MKKLVLKKDVVARINNVEMNHLRGGDNYGGKSRNLDDCPLTNNDYSCLFSCNDSCGNTCHFTCPDTCNKSCGGTCAPNQTCPYSCACPQTNLLGDCRTQDYEICRTKGI